MTATKPEKEFKAGAVRATIWSNMRLSGEGKAFNSHKVIIERIYKENEQGFKTTRSLGINDIPKAVLVLQKAYDFLLCSEQRRNDPGFHSADHLPRNGSAP